MILAIVSINLVINGGIIGRAEKGIESYLEAEIKEKVNFAYNEWKMDRQSGGTSNLEDVVENRLKESYGEESVNVSKAGKGILVKVSKSGKDYEYTLRKVANRDAVPQFFNGNYGMDTAYYNGREEISNQDFLGLVLEYDEKTKVAKIEQRNYFKIGDEVEFFGPNLDTIKYTIERIYDENKEDIDVVRHPKQIVYLNLPFKVSKYDMMRMKLY